MLARGTGIAVWRQVAEILETGIADGEWRAGGRLPTEAEMALRFGVNRHTVRQAIKDLVERGLVRSVQGSGTFVEAPPLAYPIAERTRFSDIVMAQAREPSGRLISATREVANPAVGAALELAAGAEVIRLETVRAADGVPISWALSAFPAARFADVAESFATTSSFTAAFRAAGVADYVRAFTRIGARNADAIDAERLEIALGRPVIEIEGVNTDLDGRPIQWARARFAGDRVRVTVG
ncbi:phosphonate metabolism transcriptional regulator PhnF [Siculibacillus lacustris]|uniref:Phosphonate metabolism transcriptional regulator PhnF n=1 Tax=Siculibacillus lacustris TaxID=1549641 RepID=A0A4Q9VQ04_9HYPH|nr:phosphonate metabolism transcriptional regulator PhnF [Siculibacillus lacustris]TBW37590.1 phosphonate metabolism transcriptional regulator PhnF [Siculibacillus lacustris]